MFLRFTFLLIFFNFHVVNAQFERTFMYNENNTSAFSNFSKKTGPNSYDLINIEYKSSNILEIVTASIDSLGEVITEKRLSFNYNSLIISSNLYISSVFDDNNERTIIFTETATGIQIYNFYKYDLVTGVLLDSFQSVQTSRNFPFSTQKIGNEYVYYIVDLISNEIKRVSLNATSLDDETIETVSVISSSGFNMNTYNLAYQVAKVIEYQSLETLVLVGGVSNLTFIKRLSANNYLSTSSTLPSQTPLDVCNFGNNLAVVLKNKLCVFDSSFNLVQNSQFSLFSNQSVSIYTESNELNVLTNFNSSQTTIFYEFDSGLNIIDSTIYNTLYLFRPEIEVSSKKTILAYIESKPNDLKYNGDLTLTNKVPFLIVFENRPKFEYEEYHVKFSKDDLNGFLTVGESVFLDHINGTASLLFKNRKSVIFNSSTQIVSKIDSSTYLCGRFYELDQLAGPYTTNSEYDQEIESYYNRGFLVTKQMIINHLNALNSGASNYIATRSIRNWPAHGDVTKGQAQNLAPFIDINGNGIYEPYSGDYPKIYGDTCFLSISHSRENLSNSDGIELHTYIYTINCDLSFENTFYKKIIAYSRKQDLDSLFIAQTDDVDLGNYADDFMGTHVELGMAYFYNGDLSDESNATAIGFQDTLPSFGIIQLKGSKMVDDGIDNYISPLPLTPVNGVGIQDGIVDNEYYTIEISRQFSASASPSSVDPNSPIQWWNVVNGLSKFGDALYYGTSSLSFKYAFPWESDTLHYGTYGINPPYLWSEHEPFGTGSSPNPPGDRRSLTNSKMESLQVGESVEYDYAYVFYRDSTNSPSNINPLYGLFNKAKAIKNAYNLSNSNCGDVFAPIEDDLSVKENKTFYDFELFPNPTLGKITIIQPEIYTHSKISISDPLGKVVFSQELIDIETTIDLSEYDGNMFFISLIKDDIKIQKKVLKF